MAWCFQTRDTKDRSRSFEPLWVYDLVKHVKTGDLILTSNKDLGAKIIQFFTATDWNHVGIIVKPSPNKAYLVEWGGGLFVSELVERLEEYAEWDTVDLVLRSLSFEEGSTDNRRVVEDRMEKFLDMLFRESKGSNRGIPLGDVLRAARDQYSTWTERSDAIVVDDLDVLFCSKTVAVAYKAAGLLAPSRKASRFVPKHFASESDKYLDLQAGARLGPEQRITFESRQLKDAIHNLLNMPLIEVVTRPFTAHAMREGKAAQLVQRFVRKLAARRELTRRRAVGKAKSTKLYVNAEDHGTRKRTQLLQQEAKKPHNTPKNTLHSSWHGVEVRAQSTGELLL